MAFLSPRNELKEANKPLNQTPFLIVWTNVLLVILFWKNITGISWNATSRDDNWKDDNQWEGWLNTDKWAVACPDLTQSKITTTFLHSWHCCTTDHRTWMVTAQLANQMDKHERDLSNTKTLSNLQVQYLFSSSIKFYLEFYFSSLSIRMKKYCSPWTSLI